MTDKTILLTGFDPFADWGPNPTAHVAQALDGEKVAGHNIRGIVLPVVFGVAGDALIEAIEETGPALVLCLGLAAKRPHITVERIAINMDHAEHPDNAGNHPLEQAVVADGPPAYWSTLPVSRLVAVLKADALPAAHSLSAGTYVCNHVFYRLMHHLADRPEIPGGFVHVPPLPRQVRGIDGMAEADLETGVRTMLRTIIDAAW